MEQALLAAVSLDQSNLFLGASGEPQIFQSFFVDGKNSASRAVLGRHVGNGGAIGEREIFQARAEIFDKFADHSVLAQHLGNGQNQIGSGRSFAQAAGELYADNQRNQHGHRLPQHRGLGFNSAHAPSQHPQAINHCRVTVGAD